MKNIKPVSNLLLIHIDKPKEHISNGIILPNSDDRKTKIGTVLEVGSKCESIKISDIVLLNLYAGIDIGNDQAIVKEEEILAIITG